MSKLGQMVQYAFSPDGPATALLGQHRPQQQAFARGLAAFVERKQSDDVPLFIQEVFAGLGKTVVVLVVLGLDCLLHDRSARISTFKRSLRSSYVLAAEMANAIIEHTMQQYHESYRPVVVAERKSAASYLSPSKMEALRKRIADKQVTDRSTIQFYRAYENLLAQGEDPDFSQITEMTPLPADTTELHWALCPADRNSEIMRSIRQARESVANADIIVITHAMLVRGFLAPEMDEHRGGLLVVDEADKLPVVAYDLTSISLTYAAMSEIVQDGLDEITNGDDVRAIERQIANAFEGFLPWQTDISRTLVMSCQSDDARSILAHFKSLASAITNLLGLLMVKADKNIMVLDDLVRLRQDIDFLRKGSMFGHAMLAIRTLRNPAVQVDLQIMVNFSSAKMLARSLWRGGLTNIGIAFVSASLADRPPFDLEYSKFLKSIGFETNEDRAVMLPPIRRNNFGAIEEVVVVERHLPHPTNTDESDFINSPFVDFAGTAIAALAARQEAMGPQTRALLLFPSYRLLTAILQRLPKHLKARIIHTERGRPLHSVVQQFAQTRHGMWFGVEWEGENFVDPLTHRTLVDVLVIVRLPQAPADETRIARLTEVFGKTASAARTAEWVALREATESAYRRMVQGIARGIRNKADVIKLLAILDIRFPVPPEVTATRRIARSGGDTSNIFAHFERCLEPYRVKRWSLLKEDGTIDRLL